MERALNHIAAAWHSRTIVAKLFSFATIGVLNVAVDVTVFSIAYKLFDLPLVVSNIISWSVAVSGSYAMNTKVTFGLETSGAFSWKQYIVLIVVPLAERTDRRLGQRGIERGIKFLRRPQLESIHVGL